MNVEKDIYFVDLENAFNEPTKSFSKKIKTFKTVADINPNHCIKL
jgi:hypothetical protein